MIEIPYDQLIAKIVSASGLSQEEVVSKIKGKLDELAGLISEEGAAHIVANELHVKLLEPKGEVSVKGLLGGMKQVEITGKVKNVYEVREFNTERRSGKVGSFLLVDKTGVIRCVLWNDMADKLKSMKPNDVVKVKDAYVKSNQDRLELHLGDNAKLYINPEGVTVDVDVNSRPEPDTKRIAELTGADQNVNVIATIVQVFEPRFFEVCPKCNARLRDGAACSAHGSVTPTYNYVMNLYLDDGSDNVRCVLWKDQIQKLLGKNHDALLLKKDDPTAFEDDKTDLLGRVVSVRGRVKQNETFNRLELVAYDLKKDVDPAEAPKVDKVAPVEQSKSVTEEVVVEAVVDNDVVEDVTVSESSTFDKEKKTLKPSVSTDNDLLTLEDIEDLDE